MIDQAPPEWHDPQPGRKYSYTPSNMIWTSGCYKPASVELTVPLDVSKMLARRSFWRGFATATAVAVVGGILQPIIWVLL